MKIVLGKTIMNRDKLVSLIICGSSGLLSSVECTNWSSIRPCKVY